MAGSTGTAIDVWSEGATAYAVTVLLLKRSIPTEKIARRGRHITREYGINPHQFTRVSDVMTRRVETLPGYLTVRGAVAVLETGRHSAYPIVDETGR